MNLTRDTAYTTPRSDISAMVPRGAMTILDVGCSSGELGASLRQAVVGRRVVGIEMNAQYCALAAHRLDEAICADVNNFDWNALAEQQAFDCIIFADVLEHLTNPWQHLESAAACLRPDGVIVVSLPNIRHITALSSIFLQGTFPRRPRGLFDSTHLRWFTYRDAMEMCAQAGYEVQKTSFNLRVRDRGDGRLNKLVRRILDPVAGWYPVREFLAYQYCIRATRAPKAN